MGGRLGNQHQTGGEGIASRVQAGEVRVVVREVGSRWKGLTCMEVRMVGW